jgi:hypothetical protein
MTSSSAGLMYRVRNTVEHWMHNRLQECVHCRECESEIPPFATYCPKCGQADPAKVSATAAVYPAIIGIVVTLGAIVLLDVF